MSATQQPDCPTPRRRRRPGSAQVIHEARADFLRLVLLFRPYWKRMALGAAVSLVTLLSNVALMAISGWFIASMALAGLTRTAFDYFTPAAAIRACAIVRTLGRYVERLVTHDATLRLLAELRVWFYSRVEPLAPARLADLRSADLLSRIQSDIDSLDHVYLRVLLPIVVGAAGASITVAAAAWFSMPAAIVLLISLLFAGVIFPAYLHARANEPSRASVALRAQMREAVVDAMQGSAELRVYGGEEYYARRVDALSAELVDNEAAVNRLDGLAQATLVVAASLAMWATLILVVPAVSRGTVPPADLAMLALLVLASFEAAMPLPVAMQMLGESLAAARRIFSLADAAPAVAEPAVPRRPHGTKVTFEGVGMRYREGDALALRDVSFVLPECGRLAIVGASGAGKSSLVNVLLRFWDYQAGIIRLGDTELRECTGEAVRARVAVVSQDTYLFNATLRENLLIARPDADQAALEAACRGAQLHDFIASLPHGYDTEIGEAGARLSGGQARRLAIARVLLLDAPILVLDEPTEGLDSITERALLDTVMEAMPGRSVLLITHRLSALTELVDEVLVLDAGSIVERGTPDTLARERGPFSELWQCDMREGG